MVSIIPKANTVSEPLKRLVLTAARELFLNKGYDAVGMREIAHAVDREPIQIYRLKLAKPDILAELIIELNAEEIQRLPELLAKVTGESLFERVSSYFLELYRLDVHYQPIRSVGAAFGWMWDVRYEQQIVDQVLQLLQPVAGWMAEAGLDDIQARCYGIWSVYYVGYRHAVVRGGGAEDCLAAIRPTLAVLLRDQRNVTAQLLSQKGAAA